MQLDVRGPRFAATITTLVLITALVTGSGWVALAQAIVFGLAAASPGLRLSPYVFVYRTFVKPRLAPPTQFEPSEPVRFAQGLGFAFVAVAAVGFFTGVTAVGIVAASMALAAAFMNATFGLCVGCEIYLILRRLTGRATPA
jgi:hypothetical protein